MDVFNIFQQSKVRLVQGHMDSLKFLTWKVKSYRVSHFWEMVNSAAVTRYHCLLSLCAKSLGRMRVRPVQKFFLSPTLINVHSSSGIILYMLPPDSFGIHVTFRWLWFRMSGLKVYSRLLWASALCADHVRDSFFLMWIKRAKTPPVSALVRPAFLAIARSFSPSWT